MAQNAGSANHWSVLPDLGAGNTQNPHVKDAQLGSHVVEGGSPPPLHLPQWTESQVNVIYDTSGHKGSHVSSTIPSLSPSKKPLSKLGKWLGIEDFEVRA